MFIFEEELELFEEGETTTEELIALLTTMLLPVLPMSSKSTPPCSLAASESNFSAEIVLAASKSASKFKLLRALGARIRRGL